MIRIFNNNKKKWSAGIKYLIAVMTLCMLAVTGCGKSITEKYEEKNADGSMDAPEYGIVQLAFDTGDETIKYNTCCYKNGVLYYCADRGVDENNECTFNIHAYDVAPEKDNTVIELSSRDEGEDIPVKTICGITVSDGGNITIYPYRESMGEDMQLSFNISKITYDSEGEEISRTTLEQPEGIDDINMLDSYNTICYETPDGGTYVSLMTGFTFYHILYDKTGKVSGMVKVENENKSGFPDESGNMIVCADTEEGEKYGYVDYNGRRIDTASFKELNDKNLSLSFMGVDGKKLYLADEKYIYEYDCDSRGLGRQVNLDRCGIGMDDIQFICRLDEDRLMCLTSTKKSTDLLILDKNLKMSEKESVKIAGLNREDGDLIAAINEYNRGDHEYRIEFIDYEDSGIEEMMKDVMTDSAPDIYLLGGMDVEGLINRGMLEDLVPYMEKDDVLNKDYFIDGFLDKTGNDGKQYVLMRKFYIDCLLGLGKNVGKYADNPTENMTEELIKLYDSMGNDSVFISGTAMGESAGTGLYELIMSGCISDYLDYANGKSNFDGDSYRQILELCRKVEETYVDDIANEPDENIKDGRLLLNHRNIYGIDELQYDDVVCDGDAVYIGYPSHGNIYMRCIGSTFAISSSSDKKDAAWSVIKELMTGSYEQFMHNEFNQGIPVSKKEYDEMIKEAMTTEEYTAEGGTTIYPKRITMGNNVSYGPATDKDVEAFRKLMDRAVYSKDNMQAVEVTEDVAAQYINGNKSLDDTVGVIQDKMDKYVNENR